MPFLHALAHTIRVPHPYGRSIVAQAGTVLASLLDHAATNLTALVGPALVATFWQGLALAAAVALCLRFAPRTSASWRFALWTAALFLVCLLPLAGMATAAHTSHLTPIHADPRWSFALAALWLLLSFLRAADLTRHAFRLRSLRRDATPVSAGPDLVKLLSVNRQVQICTSTQLGRPGVIGFFHPRILIPAWLFGQLTASELEQIVLHELEHLRRRDDWLNLLQKMALVLFPLNPALFWIERRLCLERELACDEGVVRRTRAPRLYATCLARLAERGLEHRALSLALGFLERQSELARRVAGVLRVPHTLSPRRNLAVAGTVATLLLGGAAELARCPQLISFAPTSSTLATDFGAPRVDTRTWESRPGATPVLYTDAVRPRLLRISLKHTRKPILKAKLRRAKASILVERAYGEQADRAALLAANPAQPAPAPAPIVPTLVRYTLVHVEGGWFLLQL